MIRGGSDPASDDSPASLPHLPGEGGDRTTWPQLLGRMVGYTAVLAAGVLLLIRLVTW